MDTRDRVLLRSLQGELGPEEAATVEEQVAGDPGLEARRRRLEHLWRGLEPPPPSKVPAFFAERLAARVESGMAIAWRRGPVWARGAAAAALLAGFVVGVGAGGTGWPSEARDPEVWPPDSMALMASAVGEAGLAEDYWQLLASDWEGPDPWNGGS